MIGQVIEIHHRRQAVLGRFARGKAAAELAEQRRQQHRETRDGGGKGRCIGGNGIGGARGGEDDKGELTCGREQQGRFERERMVARKQAAGDVGDQHLDGDQGAQRGEDPDDLVGDERQVEAHADGHEEEAEQQALERLEVHFGLVLELGLADEETREEGAEGKREAGAVGDRGGADDGQQRQRHQEVAPPAGGGKAEDAAEEVVADGPDHGDGDQPADQCVDQDASHVGIRLHRRETNKDQDRGDHDVLEEQHAKRGAADRLGRALALDQHLHDDGGGRQGQREAEDHGDRQVQPESEAGPGDGDRAEDRLPAACTDHDLAQGPELGEGELDAEQEKQEQHAEFGEGQRGFR